MDNWTDKVNTKWTPPEGLFKSSASNIAKVLYENSKDKRQAVARLNFYINRSGRNLSSEDINRLQLAKRKLIAKYTIDVMHSVKESISDFIDTYKTGANYLDNKVYGKILDKTGNDVKAANAVKRNRLKRKLRMGLAAIPGLPVPIPGAAAVTAIGLGAMPELSAGALKKSSKLFSETNFSDRRLDAYILKRALKLKQKGFNIDNMVDLITDDDAYSDYATRLLHKNRYLFKSEK
jgi:RNase P protein component